MAHKLQERYSDMVLAKIRAEQVLKDGVVFNNDYEGSPTAGAVKIPVRDEEVVVSDYDKANGITAGTGSTNYELMPISKDKAVNEIVDGYDSESVPDNLVADRLDSAGYSLARQIDIDGGIVLLAGSTPKSVQLIDKDNVYSIIVGIRKDMTKANIPNDGKRYLLVTPDYMEAILNSPQFTSASSLGDEVKQNGIVGRIAGFNVIEWNDETANLAMLAGHPRFATRATEFSVPVHIQDLSQSGKYIGASAVQGRNVYDHKVLRSVAIRSVYTPSLIVVTAVAGTSTGDTKITATVTTEGGTLAYKLNPASRITHNTSSTNYKGTVLTSGTAKVVSGVSNGDVIEVAEFNSSGKCVSVGYVTLKATDIKS